MPDPGVIRLSQFIHHPPARVWQALTDPAIHARWWAEGEVKAEPGARFTLDMRMYGKQWCEVVAVEPGRVFSYVFAPDVLNTTITWRLEPEGEGTRLDLVQSGFDLTTSIGKMAYEGLVAGWPAILARIEPALAN